MTLLWEQIFLFYDIIATCPVSRKNKYELGIRQVICMRYHTHVMTSLAASACIASYTPLPFSIGYVSGVIIGSIIPDIDEPNSYLGRRSFGMSSKVKQAFGHRGMTHSLLVWAVITAVLLVQSPSMFSYGFIIGYILHIIEDFFSVQGVPLFWPFQTKRYKSFITYRTAGFLEKFIYYISFAICVFYVVQFHLFSEFSTSVLELVNNILTDIL